MLRTRNEVKDNIPGKYVHAKSNKIMGRVVTVDFRKISDWYWDLVFVSISDMTVSDLDYFSRTTSDVGPVDYSPYIVDCPDRYTF